MTQPGYLRHPTLHRETIVFVSDDDLWSVDASGGVGRRLTAGLSEPATPCLSPDGQWIAFVGRDEQHPEVYRMRAEGGPAQRMTWLGPDVMVRGWTPEGHILFVTTYGQPFFRNYRGYTLDPLGATPQLLGYGQVNHLAFGPGNAKLIGRNTADPARWKRYRGGTAGHFWIDTTGAGTFRRMTELKGNLTSPMWIGSRIYFLSDAEGVGNLYSCRPDGSDVRRHSDHADYYARHAQTDGTRVVYQCGADIWLFDPAQDRTVRVDIDVPSHRTQAARKFVPASEHLGAVHVHPAGHSDRGRRTRQSVHLPAVGRRRSPARGHRRCPLPASRSGSTTARLWSPSATRSGEERVEVFEGGVTRTLPWDVGRVVTMRAAPKGRLVALANHRNEVLVGDVASGKLTVIDRSDAGRTEDLAWSPDGAWLAYSFWTSPRHCAIKLHDAGQRDEHPGDETRVPRLQPRLRSAGTLPVLSFGPHVRSRLRQRPVRAQLSTGRAAVPDRTRRPAAGRRSIRCPRD